MIVTTLANRTRFEGRPSPKPQASPPPKSRLVFIPPAPRPAVRPPRAVAPPTPPPPARPNAKDRISIGPPSTQRADRLLLERDKDLTKDLPNPSPQASAQATPGPLGPGQGLPSPAPRMATQPQLPPPAGQGPGIADSRPLSSSIRRIEERLGNVGGGGAGGAGRQMGPLFFDPEGADFTAWINHFKNEVYRNWVPPQAVMFGFHGHVDFEFSVERDGRVTGLRMLKSTGTPALDRAAQNALLGSRLLPLPNDYGPPRVTMQVTFFYNEAPQG